MNKNHPDENAPNAENESEEFVTWCGGIKPLPILSPPDEEE